MKKFLVPAGLLCTAAIAGTMAYKKIKKSGRDHDVMFFPMGRYIIHANAHTLTLEELINSSDLIISGRITGKTNAKWNNKDNQQPKNVTSKDIIYFDYLIKPEKTYKGFVQENTELRLRSFEGIVGGYIVEDNSQPKIDNDQIILAFLKKGTKKNPKTTVNEEFYILSAQLQSLFLKWDDRFENPFQIFYEDQLDETLNTSKQSMDHTEKCCIHA